MKESTLWLLQILTGIILIILIGVHLSTFSTILGGGYPMNLRWENVLERGKNLGYTAFYVLFLAIVLYHANYGLRTILIELTGGRGERIINIILLIIGVIAFLYGSYVSITFNFMKGG